MNVLLRVALALAVSFASGAVFAGSGQITLSGGSSVVFTVASSDCASVKAGVMAADSAVADVRCSVDPVVVGANVETSAYGSWYDNAVTALSATPGASGGDSGGSSGSGSVLHVDNPIFNLSVENGQEITLAIAGVWAAGWAFRMAIRALRGSVGSRDDEEG